MTKKQALEQARTLRSQGKVVKVLKHTNTYLQVQTQTLAKSVRYEVQVIGEGK